MVEELVRDVVPAMAPEAMCCLDGTTARGSAPDAEAHEAMAAARKLKRATVFVLVFFVIEVVGGIMAGSLAIITDAAHLLTDVSSFILAIVANEIAARPACEKLTYGPVRAEVLSALFSTVFILVLSLILVYEAVRRIIQFSEGEGPEVDGKVMTAVAFVGLLVNVALLSIFHDSHGHSHGHDHGNSHDHSHGAHSHGGHNHGHGQGDGGGGHSDDDSTHSSDGGHSDHSGHGHDHDNDHGHDHDHAGGHSGHRHGSQDHLPGHGGHDHSPKHSHGHSHGNGGGVGAGGGSHGGGGAGVKTLLLQGDGAGYGALEAGKAGAAGINGGGHSHRYDSGRSHSHGEAGGGGSSGGGKGGKRRRNINVEAAWLHAATDMVQSLGVLMAGVLIWIRPSWRLADPISTIFFALLVLNFTRHLLSATFNVLLEGKPESVNYPELKRRLLAIEGVTDVHCLHVWSLTLGRTAMTAHVKAKDPEAALEAAHSVCEEMSIQHTTIQIQRDNCDSQAACVHPCVSTAGAGKCC